MSRPLAVAYVRRDISGRKQSWHETLMRGRAKRLGYNLDRTIAFSSATLDPIGQLLATLQRRHASAVIVPSLDHLDGDLRRIRDQVRLITVDPEAVFEPWAAVEQHLDGAHAGARRSIDEVARSEP